MRWANVVRSTNGRLAMKASKAGLQVLAQDAGQQLRRFPHRSVRRLVPAGLSKQGPGFLQLQPGPKLHQRRL